MSNKLSNSVIDGIYDKGKKSGALGGKLLDAGAGGFTLFFAEKENHQKIKNVLLEKLLVPVRFDNTGSKIVYYTHE